MLNPSLRNKLLMGTAGLTVLSSLAIIIIIHTSLIAKLSLELQKRGLFMAENIANQIINPVLTDDTLNLQLILNDFKTSGKDVEYFFILDEKGNVLAHTFGKSFPEGLKGANIVKPEQPYKIEHVVTDEGHILDIAIPLLKGSIGVFHLGISEKAIRKSVDNIIKRIIYIIIVILIIAGGIGVVFSSTITRPLSDLIKTAEEISKGNLELKISTKAKGEIGLLQTAFNKMIYDLNKSREDITSAKNYVDNIIRSMNESLIVISTDGIIQDVNKVTCLLLGYDEKELVGQPFGFISQEGLSPDASGGNDITKNYVVNAAEKTYLTKDGRKIPMLFSASVMPDDSKIQGIVCVAKDITERKLAEDALKKSETSYKELSEMLGKLLEEGKKRESALLSSREAFFNMLEDVGAAHKDLQELFLNLVSVLVNSLDAKSPWTKGHSDRVAKYAVSIAKEMGFDEDTIKDINLAGLLHDIGKIGTYDYLLDKPAKLTEEEFALVKKHPAKGAEILKDIKQLRNVIPMIRHHHERVDGKGYPDGIKGEDISLSAKIMHVADTFDAIMADRPYRPSPGLEYAISELNRCSGTQFDEKVVQAFLKILSRNEH